MTTNPPENQALLAIIREAIQKAGGYIPFTAYMQHALYEPGLGYYVNGSQKWGAQGDFVTAPEISALFSHCFAVRCEEVLRSVGGGDILEIGAGSGQMAADILQELNRRGCLPHHYFILEVSAELKARQRATLAQHVPELLSRVQWLEALPAQPITGVILANEVVDAMPVHLFRLEEEAIYERMVGWENEKLVWKLAPLQDTLLQEMLYKLQQQLPLDVLKQGYESEINLNGPAWIASVATVLERGAFWVMDYGFSESEYYHPERHQGTLMCHYQHRAHADPLILPGLQDITAHVNFSALAFAGQAHGLTVADFSDQGHFLLESGLLAFLEACDDPAERFRLTQQAKQLMFPGGMGERFKVLTLTKNIFLKAGSVDRRNRL